MLHAKPLDVKVPLSSRGKMDEFIDGIMTQGYYDKHWKRLVGVSLLALHMFGRPLNTDEPIPRDDLVAINKLLAEGTPMETQVALGWLINTRLFAIALPNDKHTEWAYQIKQILNSEWASFEDLDSLVGRLNHAAMVTPLTRHFLGRLRRLKDRHGKCKRTRSTREATHDLLLRTRFLDLASKSVSINLV